MSEIIDPVNGIERMLNTTDKNMSQITGRQPTDVTIAGSSLAQVYATCALVHAVRELTQAVRDLKESR